MNIVKKEWGEYRVLFGLSKIKVKILKVNYYSELSLQVHQHRSEIWLVLQGKATVLIDSNKEQLNLVKGGMLLIKKKQLHKLINCEDTMLVILVIFLKGKIVMKELESQDFYIVSLCINAIVSTCIE